MTSHPKEQSPSKIHLLALHPVRAICHVLTWYDMLLRVTATVNLSHVALMSLTFAPNIKRIFWMAQPELTQSIWWCQWSMVLIWRPCRCRGRWVRVHTSTGSYKRRYKLSYITLFNCVPLVLTSCIQLETGQRHISFVLYAVSEDAVCSSGCILSNGRMINE
jgi:hypothetical protein